MTQTETTRMRVILEGQCAELVGLLHHRDGIEGVASADSLDQIQNASERDMAIGNIERSSSRLREVRDALNRLRLGTYGLCAECEEEISPKRLAAVPWTTSCLACREAADGASPRFTDTREMTFAQAA